MTLSGAERECYNSCDYCGEIIKPTEHLDLLSGKYVVHVGCVVLYASQLAYENAERQGAV